MGRLSAYAKNRILKLRFKKNKRIIHIVEILKRDDNIKVSRQAVSTFLKKYLETNSIYDKPRTGRKRKLTQEEIQLIGQVTRLNRDITARAIKEYLNLNVSTYTILRATKLFEWNKVNPNSNDSKKAAALERQLNGECDAESGGERRRSTSVSSGTSKRVSKRKSQDANEGENVNGERDEPSNDIDVNPSDKVNTSATSTTNNNNNSERPQDEKYLAESEEANEEVEANNSTVTDDMASQLDEIERIQSKLLISHESNKKKEETVKETSAGKKALNSKKTHKSVTNPIPGK